jgi:serine protease Do
MKTPLSVRKGSTGSRVAATLAFTGLLAVSVLGWHSLEKEGQSLNLGASVAKAQAIEPADAATVAHANALSRAFRRASEVAMPSVVTVRSKVKAKVVKRDMPTPQENPFKGTPFEDFFGGNDMRGFRNFQMPDQQPRQGMGSGVIIDKSGIVLTNNHVVAGADEVIIHLADGREYVGYDIKTDDQTDLAVVRIKATEDLPVAKLGNSDGLEIGDWVIAIGNPFELEQTVSAGIISGKGRELGSIRRAKFLQTDAAINPGNSGGPLVNLDGEVIGINTAIATNTGSFNGIGFAVPVNLAKWVVPQLVKEGKVQRAYLGVAIGEINNELAGQFGVERNSGVLVSEVFPNSPAEEAGMKTGDVIKSFAGQAVRNPRELQEIVERTTLGTKNNVEVVRDGKVVNVRVASKALPDDFGRIVNTESRQPEKADPAVIESSELGINVTDVTADQAEQLGFKGHSGALVAEVDPNGIAYAEGLRPGMLIMRVGKKEVSSAADFDAAIKKESLKDGVLLLIRTKAGGQVFKVLQEK